MPRYDFRCPECGSAFEVSRPFSRAAEPAQCPLDGATAERVFTMPTSFVKGAAMDQIVHSASTTPAAHDAHGHTHGPGTHTH